MKKFPPYRTGRFGQLQEWYEDYEECTPGMSHTSHMYPVYPGGLITETGTPELFEEMCIRDSPKYPLSKSSTLISHFIYSSIPVLHKQEISTLSVKALLMIP